MENPVGDHLKHVLGELTATIDDLIRENEQLRLQLAQSDRSMPLVDARSTAQKKSYLDNRFRKLFKKDKRTGILWTSKASFTGHSDGIWKIDASPIYNHIVATASADQTVILWDTLRASDSMQSIVYKGHLGSVNCVKFHPSNPGLFCSASGDGQAHIVRFPNIKSPEHKLTFSSSADPQSSEVSIGDIPKESRTSDELGRDSIKVSGRRKKRGSQHKRASSLHDQVSCEDQLVIHSPLQMVSGHIAPVSALAWVGDGDQMVTGSWDAVCVVWSFGEGELVKSNVLKGHDGRVTALDTQLSSQMVLSSCTDHTIRLWDIRGKSSSIVFEGHSGAVNCAIFSKSKESEHVIASSSEDRTIQLWDMRRIEKPFAEVLCHNSAVNQMAFSEEGVLAAPCDDGSVRFFNCNGEWLGIADQDSRREKMMMSSSSWSADSRTLYTSSFDRYVYSWIKSGFDAIETV